MELYNALKNIVSLQSADILKDARLVNILSDFKAYEEFAAAKFVIKSLISEGLMAKFFFEGQSQNDYETIIANNKQNLVDNYGFKEGLSEYVLKSIAFALGWIEDIPTMNSDTVSRDTGTKVEPDIEVEDVDDGKKHLTFRQIPITGNVQNFIRKLESQGYTVTNSYNHEYNVAILTGKFAGVNNCQILVVGTPISMLTCRVVISLPEQQIWFSLKSEYQEWKNKLTTKYGTPQSYEYFSEPYYEGDGYEMSALSNEHCQYSSYFTDKETEGTIVVRMSQNGCVTMVYEDKHNSDIGESEKNNIANDDL